MLERCLGSVAAQTYPRVEHIVVDGGSPPPVVAALKQAGIPFVSEPDSGQTNAINKGFAMAHGDLLGWLNADDALRPNAVARVVATLQQHPAAGWAYGDCEYVGGRAPGVWKAHPELSEALVRAGEVVPQPGSLVWSSALDAVGPLDESFDLTMDADMFLRLIDHGFRPVYVHGVLARFEVHPDSKTGGDTRAAFLAEHARALAKSGRATASAVMYGRAAVADATSGFVVEDDALRAVLPRFTMLVPDAAPEAAFQAGVVCERAIVELRTRPLRAIRSLLGAAPWRFPESRRLLYLAGRRALRPHRPRI
jgi:hypothetical protein